MWFQRPVARLLLLAGAAGGPYALYQSDAGRKLLTGSNDAPPATASTDSASGFWNANGVELKTGQFTPDELTQQPIQSLQEILRFDISPAWVVQRFPRVTTVTSELQLDAMRVPLVTGITPSDMAGTLTYYFDPYQRVQRITVHAVTGDPTRFMAELQHAYGLRQQPALGGALYVLTWNGRPTCVAYTAPAAVITRDNHQARFNVFIELNQAGLQYGLSPEAQSLIDAGQKSGRWQSR
ncbi:MAG: hypothetical protein KatS3mg111_3899 [Pirellulaceae bacterium]|nr:MAG: hypothetical protein KatS3mg111_3899 [Pirellulaceae bacterium]